MSREPEPGYATPLTALDEIVRIEPAGITTRKRVLADEPYFAGHYPGFPIYPGVFMVEAVNQAARAYIARFHPGGRLVEARTRFLSAVYPGDVLECDCACTLVDDGARLRVKATCRSGEAVASTVKLIYALGGADV